MTSSERRRRRRAVAMGAVALVVFAGVRPAAAGDEATARALFHEGRRLAAAGDYAAACPKFEESLRAEPGIGTSFNLADCWEHVGRTASAWARFLDVAAAAQAAGQPEREEVARGRAAALEPKLTRLLIDAAAGPAALRVQRDGVAVEPASWGTALPVDPGAHLIEATAPGKKTWSATVSVATPGETARVSIPALEDDPAPPVPSLIQPLPAPVAVRDAVPDLRPPVPAVIVGAAGVAALTVAAIFGLEYRKANNDAQSICPTSIDCTQMQVFDHTQEVADARHDLNVAYVTTAVGAAALAVAAVLWWRSVSPHSRY